MHQRGFTLIELVVALGLFALVSLVAAPNLARIFGQLRAAEDARRIALALVSARDEAIRLRTDVRVSFTGAEYSVDIDADGTVEQSAILDSASGWAAAPPAAIVFNGLGLARGINGAATLSILNRGAQSNITVNVNGTVTL